LYSNQCEHSCTNSFGSYGCTCNSGFYLSTDQRSCLDIDECEISEPCSQLCVNTAGSYYCQCVSKYTLNQDAHTCTLSGQSL
jgi:fibulin 1/2